MNQANTNETADQPKDETAKPAAVSSGSATKYIAQHKRTFVAITVAALLILHWCLAVSGVHWTMFGKVYVKSSTMDEVVHVTGGYACWKFNDYRINPENGNLPSRWAAIPLVLGSYQFPSRTQSAWRDSDQWNIASQFLERSGNDLDEMQLHGREMMALLSVALGLVVFFWSRSLFGPVGGLLSLALYALDPTILANGPLMTSDLCVALFFTLSIWTFWRLLERITPLRLAGSCLAMGGLFLSKMSAPLILPMVLILVIIQIASRRPLDVRVGAARVIQPRPRRALVLLGILAAHALAVYVIIWAGFGFRYSAFADGRSDNHFMLPWKDVLADQNKDTLLAAISAARNDQLLPEAYLWGFGHAYVESRERRSFLNGDYSYSGWWYFFPYSFGVKTPLATFAVLALALAAGVVTVLKAPPGDSGQPAKPSQRLTRALYRIAPLLVLLVVYWAFAIRSHINIGHRHLLPVYPALFILAGAVGHWLKTRSRIMQYLVFAAFVLVAMETYRIWPYFLAYFNQSIGGPTTAYEHMVDSSLDWGQELPRLKMWLEAKSLSQDRDPVYFSYFGSSRQPEYYGIRAIRLVSFGPPPNRPMLPVLRGGTYCFSATMLETVPVQYWGRWNSWLEKRYQETRKKRFQGTSKSLEEYVGKVDRSMNLPQEFLADVEDLDQLRFCRLAAYLRQQRPMASIGHSILIFRLTDEQAEQALYGPPVELAGQPKP